MALKYEIKVHALSAINLIDGRVLECVPREMKEYLKEVYKNGLKDKIVKIKPCKIVFNNMLLEKKYGNIEVINEIKAVK